MKLVLWLRCRASCLDISNHLNYACKLAASNGSTSNSKTTCLVSLMLFWTVDELTNCTNYFCLKEMCCLSCNSSMSVKGLKAIRSKQSSKGSILLEFLTAITTFCYIPVHSVTVSKKPFNDFSSMKLPGGPPNLKTRPYFLNNFTLFCERACISESASNKLLVQWFNTATIFTFHG